MNPETTKESVSVQSVLEELHQEVEIKTADQLFDAKVKARDNEYSNGYYHGAEDMRHSVMTIVDSCLS